MPESDPYDYGVRDLSQYAGPEDADLFAQAASVVEKAAGWRAEEDWPAPVVIAGDSGAITQQDYDAYRACDGRWDLADLAKPPLMSDVDRGARVVPLVRGLASRVSTSSTQDGLS